MVESVTLGGSVGGSVGGAVEIVGAAVEIVGLVVAVVAAGLVVVAALVVGYDQSSNIGLNIGSTRRTSSAQYLKLTKFPRSILNARKHAELSTNQQYIFVFISKGIRCKLISDRTLQIGQLCEELVFSKILVSFVFISKRVGKMTRIGRVK